MAVVHFFFCYSQYNISITDLNFLSTVLVVFFIYCDYIFHLFLKFS